MNGTEAVKSFRKLARSMAKSAATEHVLMSEDDLFQEANIAILRAIAQPSFPLDEEQRVKFVRSCILNAFRNLSAKHQDGAVTVSLDEEIGEDEGGHSMTRHDVIGVPASQEKVESIARAELRALQKLSDKDRAMLTLYAQGQTIDQIGEEFGISHQAVSQRIKKARALIQNKTI